MRRASALLAIVEEAKHGIRKQRQDVGNEPPSYDRARDSVNQKLWDHVMQHKSEGLDRHGTFIPAKQKGWRGVEATRIY